MIKVYLKRGWLGLGIGIFLFFCSDILNLFDFDNFSLFLFYTVFLAWSYAFYNMRKYVSLANKKILKRLLNKKTIFTDDLLEDDDDKTNSNKSS